MRKSPLKRGSPKKKGSPKRGSPKKKKSPKRRSPPKRNLEDIRRELASNVYYPKSPSRKPVKKSGRRTVTCSVCGEIGHNKRYHK